jgi:hypothetical protein
MRPNSWTKSRQKSAEFSSLLFTVISTALPLDFYFFKLMQPLTVSTVQLLYTVKEKEGKPDRKPKHPSLWFKNPYRNLNFENSQDHAQKPQTKLYIHKFGFWSLGWRTYLLMAEKRKVLRMTRMTQGSR